jgi:hypothetical protein
MKQGVVRQAVPIAVAAVVVAIAIPAVSYAQKNTAPAAVPAQHGSSLNLAVGPQYDSTHVYVAPSATS